MRGFGTGFRDMGFGTRIRPASFLYPKINHRFPAFFGPVEMCELSELSELSPQDAVGLSP